MQVQAIQIPTYLCTPRDRFTCVCLPLPSLSPPFPFFPWLFTAHTGEDGKGIHHLAPHGWYTSNTLRVSQLTPSQTFHFVVQRARHGAHDGSHKWKPTPAGPRCYSLFLVSPSDCAELGRTTDGQLDGASSISDAGFSYPEDRSHFCANPSSLCGRPRISDSAATVN